MGDDPRYPRRLAIAFQNRGLALQVRGREDDAVSAAASFGDAIAVLEEEYSAAIEDRDYLRAVVWLNLASLRAIEATADARADARGAAGRALAYVRDHEANHPQAAAVGLQGRHLLCRLCAHSLSQAAHDDGMPEDVHEATDAVDEGLALVRSWEQRGVDVFRAFAFDLFRFGARVYARYQPQFLDEVIAENLDPALSSPGYVESADMQLAAQEALQLVAARE
jgi:hypothetical protein